VAAADRCHARATDGVVRHSGDSDRNQDPASLVLLAFIGLYQEDFILGSTVARRDRRCRSVRLTRDRSEAPRRPLAPAAVHVRVDGDAVHLCTHLIVLPVEGRPTDDDSAFGVSRRPGRFMGAGERRVRSNDRRVSRYRCTDRLAGLMMILRRLDGDRPLCPLSSRPVRVCVSPESVGTADCLTTRFSLLCMAVAPLLPRTQDAEGRCVVMWITCLLS